MFSSPNAKKPLFPAHPLFIKAYYVPRTAQVSAEWKQIVCWHIVKISLYVTIRRLFDGCLLPGLSNCLRLYSQSAGLVYHFCLMFHFVLFSTFMNTCEVFVFLVNVCGIVQVQGKKAYQCMFVCVFAVHVRIGLAVFINAMIVSLGIPWETCGSRTYITRA